MPYLIRQMLALLTSPTVMLALLTSTLTCDVRSDHHLASLVVAQLSVIQGVSVSPTFSLFFALCHAGHDLQSCMGILDGAMSQC